MSTVTSLAADQAELAYPFEQVFAKGFDVDPWKVYKQIKAEAPPILYSLLTFMGTGAGVWYVTASEDVRTVFQDYSRFTTSFDYAAGETWPAACCRWSSTA